MFPRYTLPEMAAVFSDEARFARYLEIELLATDAHAVVGVVPAADAARCRERAPKVDAAFVEAVAERERITDHDKLAGLLGAVAVGIGRAVLPCFLADATPGLVRERGRSRG